ncbi:hypothetical protein [Microcoleus sp. S13C4]|uniref:hypothetical protein n=1 Tax=Microcoleus sp. S13C4 TaxID=3055410 RepID=UPI002FCF2452
MPIAINTNSVYNPLNIRLSGSTSGFLIPIVSSLYQDCLQICPWGSDRNCLLQVLLCSDIALANIDRTCGHLNTGFLEKILVWQRGICEATGFLAQSASKTG